MERHIPSVAWRWIGAGIFAAVVLVAVGRFVIAAAWEPAAWPSEPSTALRAPVRTQPLEVASGGARPAVARGPDAFDPGITALGPDWTVDDLVMGHDLVAIGTIGAVLSTELSPNDQEMAQEYPQVPPSAWDDFGRESYTQFAFSVEEVLLDRLNHVASGKPVVLFTPFGPPYPPGSVAPDGYVRTGDRYLVVLSYHDDADWPPNLFVTWDLYRDCISVDGPAPLDAMGQPVPSAGEMTTAEFLAEVEMAVDRVYGSP